LGRYFNVNKTAQWQHIVVVTLAPSG
jgi:hypothetical protein